LYLKTNKKTQRHHRSSVRLKGYDYSQEGAYFLTICTYNQQMLLEKEDYHTILQKTWDMLPHRYPQIHLDEFIIMPNHVHGIVWIDVGAIHESPLQYDRQHKHRSLLSKIVGYFKMNCAKQINLLRARPGIPFWQRSYYEHIIRSDQELNRIREYIQNNPLRWELDRENPDKTDTDEFDNWLYGNEKKKRKTDRVIVGAIHESPLQEIKTGNT